MTQWTILAAVMAVVGAGPALAMDNTGPIDRQALVARHNVVITTLDDRSPLQVGNGEFAFGVDVTGLQTFVPFNTMSHWGWHSMPLPPGTRPEQFRGQLWDTHGRMVRYPMEDPEHPALSHWLASNPHRLNLGRIGLLLFRPDGRAAAPSDLRNPRQELDLWHGIITSRFQLDGQPVSVWTCCHPLRDAVAVRVESPLIRSGRLRVALDFPYGDDRQGAAHVGDWSHPERHATKMTTGGPNRADFQRKLDADGYHVALAWETGAALQGPDRKAPHHLELRGAGAQRLAFVACFSPSPLPPELPGVEATFQASAKHWPAFWSSGGAIDLSASKDGRWRELERRIVLSQYLLAVNEAGSLLPVEDGLYVLHEGVRDMWSKWNWEHPALTGVFGVLPGDGVDRPTIERTFDQVTRCWNFNRTWGWDFPMLAMCGARLGQGGKAVDLLLHPAGGFRFDERGLAAGGPFPYFPANGGLLYAVAMMAAGWDGAPNRNAPGFPDDGTWTVRWEGLKPAP